MCFRSDLLQNPLFFSLFGLKRHEDISWFERNYLVWEGRDQSLGWLGWLGWLLAQSALVKYKERGPGTNRIAETHNENLTPSKHHMDIGIPKQSIYRGEEARKHHSDKSSERDIQRPEGGVKVANNFVPKKVIRIFIFIFFNVY
jgi:hypothetical protein